EIARWTANYVAEREGVTLYEALAAAEKDLRRAEVLRRMAAVEARHAARWEARLREAGVEPPPVRPGVQARVIAWLARRLGVDAVLPLVRGMELRAAGSYAGQADAADLVPDERGHARTLAAMTDGRAGGASVAAMPAGATADGVSDPTAQILGR